MTYTLGQLITATNALEGKDSVRSANPTETGWWSRFAQAAESLAGSTSTANANRQGYMLRAAVALEGKFGGSGAEENVNEAGLIKRIVDALELNTGVQVGSYGNRFALSSVSVTFSLPLQPYTLLNNLDEIGPISASGASVSITHGTRKVLGSGALAIASATAYNPTFNNLGYNVTTDLSANSRIGFFIDKNDTSNSARAGVEIYDASGNRYIWTTDAGVSAWSHLDPAGSGRAFVTFDTAHLKFGSTPVSGVSGAKRVNGGVSTDATSNFYQDNVMDALVALPSTYKPNLIFTMDDMYATSDTVLRTEFANRGFVGNILYADSLLIGGIRLDDAAMQRLIAAGWGVCIDSARDDAPVNVSTRAAGIAELNANRDAAVARYGSAVATKIMGYSWDYPGYKANVTITTTGTPSGNTMSTVGYVFGGTSPGMRIFDGTTDTGLHVASVTGSNAITMTGTLTGSARTFNFVAHVYKGAVTCNGTTTVTMADTSYLFPGQTLRGNDGSSANIVTVVNGTTLTMSAAVPATCTRANFMYEAGEWHTPKWIADAKAAGYIVGRWDVGGANVCTAYGVDPSQTLIYACHSFDDTTTASTQLAQVQAKLQAGLDVIVYAHQLPGSSNLTTFLDGIKTMRDAGLMNIVNVKDWQDQLVARSPINTGEVLTTPTDFGYNTGEGSGSAVQVAWPSELDSSYYTNNTGSTITVNFIDLLNITTTATGINLKAAIYADNNGSPGALLGTTATLANIAAGTVRLTMNSPVAIPDGTKIWLATQVAAALKADGGTAVPNTTRMKYRSLAYGAFPDPFASTATFTTILPARFRTT